MQVPKLAPEVTSALLGAALESSVDGLVVVSGGGVLFRNRLFDEMWAIPPELRNGDGRKVLELAASRLRDPGRRARGLLDVADGEPAYEVLELSDGRFIERRCAPPHRDGPVVSCVSAYRDVTARKRAEDALREGEERYRQLVELVPDGIAVHCDGKLVFVNGAGARLFGAATSEELLGRPIFDLVHPSSRAFAADRVRQVLEGRELPLAEELLLRLDGTALPVEIAAMPFRHQGRPAALVALRDLTRHRRAERVQAALFRIAEVASSAPDMETLYASIHAIVGELTYAQNFYVALADDDGATIRFPYFVDAVDPNPGAIVPGRTLTGYVLRSGQPLLCSPEVFARLASQGAVELVGGASLDWLGVPLKRGEQTFGVLAVQSYSEGHRFTEADRELLTFVSQHVATAIDRTRASESLRESEAKFRTLAETTPIAIFISQGGSLRYVNPAMAAATGFPREELEGMTLRALVHPSVRQRLAADGGLEPGEHELPFVCQDGSERWFSISVGRLEYDGQPAVLGTAHDTTERKRAEQQIRDLAFQDALTGLPNRRLFTDRLQLAVAQAHRSGQHLAVLFLDIDRFKIINDSLGHSVGDELLREVGRRLQQTIREGDTVARLGGDEFILLLPGLSRGPDLARVAGKLLEALRLPFQPGGREVRITASLGGSLFPEDGADVEALIQSADTAMYRAKDQGRDTYQRFQRPGGQPERADPGVRQA
ncbi:MAG TPA: diguanylate cyclase [Anaeromyxobacteraceae bacterium]|nr:diguanylate cyclase [Anaeromyxobacteraceae bacterium]